MWKVVYYILYWIKYILAKVKYSDLLINESLKWNFATITLYYSIHMNLSKMKTVSFFFFFMIHLWWRTVILVKTKDPPLYLSSYLVFCYLKFEQRRRSAAQMSMALRSWVLIPLAQVGLSYAFPERNPTNPTPELLTRLCLYYLCLKSQSSPTGK